MEALPCESSGCSNNATTHLSLIENRLLAEEEWLCQDHINDFMDDFLRRRSSSDDCLRVIRHEVAGFVPVAIHLIVYDQRFFREGTSCWVYLAEMGGVRRLAVPTGYFETSNLEWELKGQPFSRPPTHRVLSKLICATGGRLEHILLDEYQENEQRYRAKLCLAYGQRSLEMDVRPSDAFLVAVACSAPIFVSDEVLETAGKSPPS